MSFLLMSAQDVHYGPVTISTEEANFHEQIGNELSISTKYDHKSRKAEAHKAKADSKMKELEKNLKEIELKMKDFKDDATKDSFAVKADKMKQKIEDYFQRKQGIINVIEGKQVKFDPRSKSYIIKLDDSPVRVLNKLGKMGFQVIPSPSGTSTVGDFRTSYGQVWTLYRHGPPPAYYPFPELSKMPQH